MNLVFQNAVNNVERVPEVDNANNDEFFVSMENTINAVQSNLSKQDKCVGSSAEYIDKCVGDSHPIESLRYEEMSTMDMKKYVGVEFEEFEVIFSMVRGETQSSKFDAYLNRKNQMVICLFKLRMDLDFQLIAKVYSLDRQIISGIFFHWINIMYFYLKKVDFWKLGLKSNQKYACILDCSEIVSESSSTNLRLNQVLFSQYKNKHTVKYMIAIDELGLIIFCSEAYGGSASDRMIFEECGIMNHLQENDCVLADRGFTISDILENKKVILNIPPFMNGRDRLPPSEAVLTRVMAQRRIHVERVIGLTKKFRMLKFFKASMLPHASKIIFVINMLCNFKNSIVHI